MLDTLERWLWYCEAKQDGAERYWSPPGTHEPAYRVWWLGDIWSVARMEQRWSGASRIWTYEYDVDLHVAWARLLLRTEVS